MHDYIYHRYPESYVQVKNATLAGGRTKQYRTQTMIIITNDSFPEIHSTPDWLRTRLLRGVFIILFGLLTLLFYVVPILFYVDGTVGGKEIAIFSAFYYPFMVWMSFLAFRHFKSLRGSAIVHIRVNLEGIFYEKVNGSVEMLRYEYLDQSYNSAVVFDVFAQTMHRYGPTELRIFSNRQERSVRFHTDAGYSYYSGNVRALRGHFIRGITLFRPDLNIAPNTYSSFYINSETYEFDKKDYWKTMMLAGVFIMLVFIAIEWYMQHRFGESSIFK